MKTEKLDPRSAVEALFPTPIKLDFGVTVYPLSLAHYALLEKINSYILVPDHQPTQDEVLMSFYICTHEPKDILDDFDNLKTISYQWAEQLPPSIVPDITSNISLQISRMMDVIPLTSDKKKVTQTAS